MAQIKNHKDRKTKKSKAKACLFAAVSSSIFTRIMSLKSAKAIWDYLKAEYEGDEIIRGMQVLNLLRDFELQRMKESESIKDYANRLLSIANRAQEQRRIMREDEVAEGALPSKHNDYGKNKKKKNMKNHPTYGENSTNNYNKGKVGNLKGNYPPSKHCSKKGHSPFKCWSRPDARCSKCNQLGYEAVIFKSKN